MIVSRTPRQNRVDPFGRLIADRARGAWLGNRGCLHDAEGRIRRQSQLRRWIYCVLEFKGRRRAIMQPGHYTELFFLDEPTALAAGHRPCAECQRRRYNEFRSAWRGEADEPLPSAEGLDRALEAERVDAAGEKVTFKATLGDLPDGVMVIGDDGRPALIWAGQLRPWTPSGYEAGTALRRGATVELLTPASTVRALAGGFEVRAAAPG